MADISFGITGDSSEFLEAMNEAKEKASEVMEQITEKVKGVGESFETLQRTAAAFAAVVVGGEVLEKLGQLAERAENMKDLAEQFGVTTTDLQGLQAVALETGVTTERLEKSATGLQAEMSKAGQSGGEAAEKFEALGISFEQLRDPSFSVIDAMTILGRESNSSSALVGVLGPRLAGLIPVMRELAQNHNAVSEAAAKTNALTRDEIEDLEMFHATLEQNNIAWENWETRVAVGVVPVLQAAVQQLTQFATGSQSATEFGELLAQGLAKIAIGAVEVIKWFKDWVVIQSAILTTGLETFSGLADAQDALLHGHFQQTWEKLKQIPLEIKSAWGAAGDAISDNATQATSAINQINLAASGLSEVHPSLEHKAVNPLPDLTKPQEDPFLDMMAKLDAETQRSENERLGIIVRSAQEATDARRDAALGAIAVAEQEAQQEYNLGQITAAQLLQQQRDLAREKLGVELQAAGQKALLAGQDVVAESKADQQIAKAHAANLQQMTQAEAKYAQTLRQTWQTLSNQISSAFSNAIKGMLEGTETFGQAVRNIWNSLLGAFVDMLIKMLAQWVTNQLLQMAIGKTNSESTISNAAAVAGAQGTASFAGAPWPVDMGAPAFGASMALAAGSFSLASAAGGYDIPSNVNPLTQLHANEMVLPAPVADTVRDGMKRGKGVVHIHGGPNSQFTSKQLQGMLRELGYQFKLV